MTKEFGLGALPTEGWLDPPPVAYIEAHIEQGPVLAAAGAPLGVVTSIAVTGPRSNQARRRCSFPCASRPRR